MNWLIQFIDYKKISVLFFEKKIGVRSTIQKAIKGNSNLGSNLLAKIVVEFPDVNPDWLLTGKGEMLRKTEENKEKSSEDLNLLKERLNGYKELNEIYLKKIDYLQNKLDECESQKKRV